MKTADYFHSTTDETTLARQIARKRDLLLRDCLGTVCYYLAIFCSFIAGIDFLFAIPPHSFHLAVLGAGIAILFVLVGWKISCREVNSFYVNPLAGGIASCLFLHLITREYLMPSTANASIISMYFISLGAFFLSTRWLIGMLAASLTTSILVMFPSLSRPQLYEILLLFSSGILFSLVLHVFRSRMFGRMAQLRLEDEKIARELNEAVSRSKANETKFRRISESIPFGIFQVNESGICEYTNNNWRTLCIASNVMNVEHRWCDILSQDIREDAFEDWKSTVHNFSNFQGVYQQKNRAGELRWVELSISPVFSDDGVVFIGTAEDITEKKIAHDKLRQTANDLRVSKEAQDAHARKLEQVVKELEIAKSHAEQSAKAKSEFLANMSHEIRTPMTAVLGYTDLLLNESESDSHIREALETIKRNGEHLLQIINDILDISKIEAGKMEIELMPCSPRKIVEEAMELMMVRAKEKSLYLTSEFEGYIPEFIQTDPTRLRQILLNLLSNAIKFTQTGGVTLKVQLQNADAPNEQPHLKFSVLDTGIGMSQEQADNLFQPFTQADSSMSRRFGGTGLGLSISKRLASKLGGDIEVRSEKGKGSCFCASIATGDLSGVSMIDHANSAKPEPHRGAGTSEETPNSKKKNEQLNCKLLLVEDGVDNQRLISFLMKKAGADVTIAENGLIGIEKTVEAIELGEPFEIILMDMQMPVMDGYTAAAKLREKGIETPIIALTAHAMSGDREKCIQAGCSDYGTKPINKNQLIETIQKLLNAEKTAAV